MPYIRLILIAGMKLRKKSGSSAVGEMGCLLGYMSFKGFMNQFFFTFINKARSREMNRLIRPSI